MQRIAVAFVAVALVLANSAGEEAASIWSRGAIMRARMLGPPPLRNGRRGPQGVLTTPPLPAG